MSIYWKEVSAYRSRPIISRELHAKYITGPLHNQMHGKCEQSDEIAIVGSEEERYRQLMMEG